MAWASNSRLASLGFHRWLAMMAADPLDEERWVDQQKNSLAGNPL
jgi:hypothetical protein